MSLSFLNKITTFNDGDSLYLPSGLDTDGTNLYVLDAGNRRIVIFDLVTLAYVDEFTNAVFSGLASYNLKDIAVDNNYIYVTDRTQYIRKFDKSTYELVLSVQPTQGKPQGITTSSNGYTYCVGGQDSNFLRRVFTSDLTAVDSSYGVKSLSMANYAHSGGVIVEGSIVYWCGRKPDDGNPDSTVEGSIVLMNALNCTELITEITYGNGSNAVGFIDITLDSDYIYVTHPTLNIVVIFDKSLRTFVETFGSSGSSDGQFSKPYGITYYNNKIYVADSTNNRIQVFDTTGSGPPPSTSHIKNINGIAYANIKTVNFITEANMKNFNGVE